MRKFAKKLINSVDDDNRHKVMAIAHMAFRLKNEKKI